MKNSERIGTLMFRHLKNELSRKEKEELNKWRSLSPENDRFFLQTTDTEYVRGQIKRMSDSHDQILEKLKTEFPDLFETKPRAKVRPLKRILSYAAVLLTITGLFRLFPGQPSVNPGQYQAVVVSPEGAIDDLNSVWRDFKRGFSDGYAGIIRKTVNGQLIYMAPNEVHKTKDSYYTLFTKRGGAYGLQLADGTMIWVNAETTIHYPANLLQDTVHITIDGESFIEIPDSAKHVYVINTGFPEKDQPSSINNLRSGPNAMQIITRAARFNVTSRADETAPVVSLISGTATVQTDDANPVSPVSITAGQQIEWISGKLQTGSMKNPGDVIAWKNNRTSFHDAGIKTIMLEVARWYDVDVEYSGTIPDLKYSITISRDAKIEDLLVLLRKQGGHFTLHRRTIHVSY